MLGPFSFLSNPHALKLYWIWAWKIPCNQTQCVWPWNEKERCLNAKITIRQWMRGMFSLHTGGCPLRLPGLGNLCSGTPQVWSKKLWVGKIVFTIPVFMQESSDTYDLCLEKKWLVLPWNAWFSHRGTTHVALCISTIDKFFSRIEYILLQINIIYVKDIYEHLIVRSKG